MVRTKSPEEKRLEKAIKVEKERFHLITKLLERIHEKHPNLSDNELLDMILPYLVQFDTIEEKLGSRSDAFEVIFEQVESSFEKKKGGRRRSRRRSKRLKSRRRSRRRKSRRRSRRKSRRKRR